MCMLRPEPRASCIEKQHIIYTHMFIYTFLLSFVIRDFFKKRFVYSLYFYEYTVAVFRHTRRGHCISLQMVVSHHVDAGN